MTDKHPNQAAGGDGAAEQPVPASGGESGGGHYPNPHDDQKDHPSDGLMGHGGQTDIAYRGTGDRDDKGRDNDNAATGSD